MRVLYPLNPLLPKQADLPYSLEYELLKKAGINCSLFDYDSLSSLGEFTVKPKIELGELVLYRGWMFNPSQYQVLIDNIEASGGTPVTNQDDYLKSHHLPGWYEQCKDITAETYFFKNKEELSEKFNNLGWDGYFVKDYVKSNSTEIGSIARSLSDIHQILSLIKEYRGEIEGGIAIRKLEQYLPETEQRYFIMNRKIYSPDGQIPDILEKISNKLDVPFYSVDLIKKEDGEYHLVEVGDAQVSDMKNWDINVFVDMMKEITAEPTLKQTLKQKLKI